MNLGEKIRFIRKNKKMTMKELGDMISMSEQAIGNYERGDREPNLDILHKISKALNVNINEIIDITDETTLNTSGLFDDISYLLRYNKNYESLISESFHNLINSFLVLYIPSKTNSKEYQENNTILLNKLMNGIQNFIELDMYTSPQKYPDDFKKESVYCLYEIYKILEDIRLNKISNKD